MSHRTQTNKCHSALNIQIDVSKLQQYHLRYNIRHYLHKLEKIDIVGKIVVQEDKDNLFISIVKSESLNHFTPDKIMLVQELMCDLNDKDIKVMYNKIIDGLGDYLFNQSFNMLFDLKTFQHMRSSWFNNLYTK